MEWTSGSAATCGETTPLRYGPTPKRRGSWDRVAPIKADPGSLPFVDSSVDAVLSALSLHRLIRRKSRTVVFTEIARVLKEGGRIGILDAGNGGQYSMVLHQLGMTDIHVRRLRFS